MSKSSLETILSDKIQSLLDDFAALLDVRVTFFSVDGGHSILQVQSLLDFEYSNYFLQHLLIHTYYQITPSLFSYASNICSNVFALSASYKFRYLM